MKRLSVRLTLKSGLRGAVLLSLLQISGSIAGASEPGGSSGNVAGQIKASYVYNFLKFVSFQQESLHEGMVKLCLLGRSEFDDALHQIDGRATPQGQLKVIWLGPFDPKTSFLECNALYVFESESKQVERILGRVDTHRILTISEFSPFIRLGGLIELYERDDSIRFRINDELVKETEYKVAAQLVQLGVD